MGFWLLFVIVAIAVGNLVGTAEVQNSGNVGETARAEQIIDSANFPPTPGVERVLIGARQGSLDRAAAATAAADVATGMKALPDVASVEGPVAAPDGSLLMLTVTMAGDRDTAEDRVGALLDTTAAAQREHPGLLIEETGWPSISKGYNDTIGKDFQRAEIFSVPVTLLILLIAFGALIAAGVPVVLALSAVGAAIGLSALASHLVPAQDTTNSVILLIGLAVGVDYSLFYLRREREERAKGAGHLDAVEIAAATSGRAVVVSGIAVLVSMAGMFLANDNIFSSLAVGSIMVVAVSVLGSVTVLPALLVKLGRWVDRPRIPFLWRLTAQRQTADGQPGTHRVWSALLRPALRHPLITFVLSAAALIALAVPALGMTLKLTGINDFPKDIPAVAAYDRLTQALPSTGSRHEVVVRGTAGQAGLIAASLHELADRATADPLFAHDVTPEVELSPDGTVSIMEIGTPYAVGTDDARRSLDRLRDDLVPATVGTLSGVEFAVTGEIAGTFDYADHVSATLPIVVGFVLLFTFIVMVWTFRSMVVALTAIGLNLLSVGAAYGVLVLVFQNTWAEGILDFQSNHGIIAWLPIFLFVVLFGLSMDYHVFVVSRIREAVLGGMPNRDAVAQGIIGSAGVVTSAAAVMVGVFSIFATLSTLEFKQLGVGLAVAILIDATIIRAVVLPSVMTLLGNANWWAPRFLRPRPSAAHADDAEPAPAGVLTSSRS
jgi:RND superfamily putative drug exporter